MRPSAEARRLIEGFPATAEERKSVELILALLDGTAEPYSRNQFHPGHITCSALVWHPEGDRMLLMLHHRHKRWLLPGGHVEEEDATLADAARREAIEETAVQVAAADPARLVGLDVHAIPPHKGAPFHLHHDLVFALTAESAEFAPTEEAPQVAWCRMDEFDRYGLPVNIRQAARRGAALFGDATESG